MKQLDIHSNPLAAVIQASPAGIIAQEKAGQAELAKRGRDAQLPKDCSAECRKALEAAGVKFFEMVDGDPLFRHATLPVGWEIKPTDHDMYSDLLDEQGRKRASIGYKAAFYDRWAQLSCCRRFEAGYFKDDYGDPDAQVYPGIKDGGKLVWRGKFMADSRDVETLPRKKEKNDEIGWVPNAWGGKDCVFPSDFCRNIATNLLTKLYPDWNNPTAYWDITPTWPKSESEPMPGEEYRLHVSLYNVSGTFCDSGSQTTRKATSDAEGVRKLKADAERAFKGRYRVEARVTCGERTVDSFTIDLPRPKMERQNGWYRTSSRLGVTGDWDDMPH